MRDPERFPREAVEEVARDRFARRVADAVNEAVELWPVARQIIEQLRDLRVVADVAVENQRRAEVARKLGNPLLETIYRLWRNPPLRLFPARKAESQKLPLPGPRHRTLLLVHLELELLG